MVATLTVTPQPATASVLLQVDPDGAEVVSIQRRDDNGTRPVRTVAGLLPSDDVTILTDYEAALSGELMYTVILDDASVVTETTALDAPSPWLSLPLQVNLSQELRAVLRLDAFRDSGTTVHQVIGRPDPLVTLGVLRNREGAFSVWVPTYEDARSVATIYARQQVALLRLPEHTTADLYHVAQSVRVAPLNAARGDTRWEVEVSFVEVGSPAGFTTGALGWTYESVTENYADYAGLLLDFPEYADLQVGSVE